MSQGKIVYYARLECGCEDRVGPTLGPFPDYLELTYDNLRVGPEGEEIAQYCWRGRETVEYSGWYAAIDDYQAWYSDIILWGELAPESEVS